MNKHLYEDEITDQIRLKIGYNNYESILTAASEHKFDGNQVANFTKMLGKKVGRGHTRRMRQKKRGHASDISEMKRILSDYYCETMHDMTSEDAIETLAICVEDYLKVPNLLTAGKRKLPPSSQEQRARSISCQTSEDPDLRRFMDEYSETVHNKDPDAPGQRFCTPGTLSHLAAELPRTLSSSPSHTSSDSR